MKRVCVRMRLQANAPFWIVRGLCAPARDEFCVVPGQTPENSDRLRLVPAIIYDQ